MMHLSDEQLKQMNGKVIAASTLLGYLAVVAGAAAIIKILTSSRGRVNVGVFSLSWGK